MSVRDELIQEVMDLGYDRRLTAHDVLYLWNKAYEEGYYEGGAEADMLAESDINQAYDDGYDEGYANGRSDEHHRFGEET